MLRILCVIIVIVLTQLQVNAQLSLFDCHQKAVESHPLGLKKAELEQIKQLNLKIIESTYLPQLKLNGQATYQSDVVSIDLDIPGMDIDIPSPSKDQYKMAVEINQMIYDGGLTKQRKNLEQSTYNADLQQVEVDLYGLKEQVNTIFFQVFILEENKQLIHVVRQDVEQKLTTVKSGVENGVLLESDEMQLEAELIKLAQTIEELDISVKTTKEILAILIGEELGDIELVLPENFGVEETAPNRPEHLLFQYQKEKLATVDKLKATEKMPKLYGFGQLAYGRPGFNMLSDEFDSYYMVGLSLSWNIWDWKKVNKERQVYKVQENIIDANQLAFNQNLDVNLKRANSEIEKLEKAIARDNQLIELQDRILKSFSSQLDHGVITSTDYITQLNAVTQAKINMKTQEIQLVQAKINLKTIQGNL
jgi:outer membrane protein TolC